MLHLASQTSLSPKNHKRLLFPFTKPECFRGKKLDPSGPSQFANYSTTEAPASHPPRSPFQRDLLETMELKKSVYRPLKTRVFRFSFFLTSFRLGRYLEPLGKGPPTSHRFPEFPWTPPTGHIPVWEPHSQALGTVLTDLVAVLASETDTEPPGRYLQQGSSNTSMIYTWTPQLPVVSGGFWVFESFQKPPVGGY